MKIKNKILGFCLFLGLFECRQAFAISEGGMLFTKNKSREAIPLLEAEIAGGNASGDTFNYLGLSYFQIGEYKKSIEAFDNALKSPSVNKVVINYNKGNSYYALKEYSNAAKCFTNAIELDRTFAKAFLNRANSYLQLKRYIEAISDYTNFLKLEPKNPQRVKIIKLIGLLKEEQKRLDAEAAAQRQLTEEYSDNPDFYDNSDLEELFEDNEDFYNHTRDDSELYKDEYFGADKKSDDSEESLSAAQKKMLKEDKVILDKGQKEEEERQKQLREAEELLAEEKRAEEERKREEKRLKELREAEELFKKIETIQTQEIIKEIEKKEETKIEPEPIFVE